MIKETQETQNVVIILSLIHSFASFIHSIIFFIFESIFILPISSNIYSIKEMLTIIQTTIFFLTESKFQTYFVKAFFIHSFTIHNTLI